MKLTEEQFAAMEARRAANGIARALAPKPLEKDLHEQIQNECKARGWIAVHSRMDKRSTQQKGVPDFIIFATGGKTYAVEAKRKGGKLSTDQLGFHRWLSKLGHNAHTVYSIDEFLQIISTP